MSKISAIVNTLNEEKNIQDCLESLKWCDEIVVVDMYSDDKTIEIAKQYTDKIFFHERVGYVEPARQFALEKATGDWIFILDADERVPRFLAEALRLITEENSHKKEIIAIPRKNFMLGKWIKYGGNYPDYQLRFFRKGTMNFGDRIHRSCSPLGNIYRLNRKEEDKAIIHFSYTDINSMLKRLLRYTDIEARYLFKQGKEFSVFSLIFNSLRRFFNYYFLKSGFLDGLPGLVVCLNASLYRFVTYVKLWELKQGNFNQNYDKVSKSTLAEYEKGIK